MSSLIALLMVNCLLGHGFHTRCHGGCMQRRISQSSSSNTRWCVLLPLLHSIYYFQSVLLLLQNSIFKNNDGRNTYIINKFFLPAVGYEA
jgi:hypothetical protein